MRRKTVKLTGREREFEAPKATRSLTGGLISGAIRFIGQKIWALIYPLLVSIALSILAIVAGAIIERIKKALSKPSG